ncbi:MAG: hypothetical protein EVB11_12100 [Winogradskyella sp.]|nr:MAG: hypothetical protein EVB11_12100 [Winogradskyella sp.]
MKSIKRLSLFLGAFLIFCSFTIEADKSYIGKWKGKDKGDIGFLTLTKDRYATFEFDGEIMGGKSYNHQGITAALKYRVNTKKDPYRIDFIIWDKKKAIEVGKLRGILKMNSNDEMQMAINFSGSNNRPTDFLIDSITFLRSN